jgi:hypothetical protein
LLPFSIADARATVVIMMANELPDLGPSSCILLIIISVSLHPTSSSDCTTPGAVRSDNILQQERQWQSHESSENDGEPRAKLHADDTSGQQPCCIMASSNVSVCVQPIPIFTGVVQSSNHCC